MKEHYLTVLGLNHHATDEEIRERYRSLAKKYHPDVNSDPSATAQFQEIVQAYDWLTSAEPGQAPTSYYTPESDYERRKREFLQRKFEKERIEKEGILKKKIKLYSFIRPTCYITLTFSLFLIIDNILPYKTNEEILAIKYQVGKSRGRYGGKTYQDYWITNKTDFRVPLDVYFDFEEGMEVLVTKTRILEITKEVEYSKNSNVYYFETPNIYDFLMALPILILISSYFPIRKKEYAEGWLYAGYGALAFSAITILILVT